MYKAAAYKDKLSVSNKFKKINLNTHSYVCTHIHNYTCILSFFESYNIRYDVIAIVNSEKAEVNANEKNF